MKEHFDRIYILALYCILGTLMAINAISLIAGAFVALIPLVFQGTVVYALVKYKPWAAQIVIAWSALAIISAIATLIAASLGDDASAKTVYFRIATLLLGCFFAYFAKTVISRRAQPI